MKSAGYPPAVCLRKIVASGGQWPVGRFCEFQSDQTGRLPDVPTMLNRFHFSCVGRSAGYRLADGSVSFRLYDCSLEFLHALRTFPTADASRHYCILCYIHWWFYPFLSWPCFLTLVLKRGAILLVGEQLQFSDTDRNTHLSMVNINCHIIPWFKAACVNGSI